MLSVWKSESAIEKFESLCENISTDVLVVGGGIAGVLSAYILKQNGVDCVVLEADRVCKGVTQNTTAKITSQHGLIYDKLIKHFGIEKAQMYLKANEDAVRRYREMCKEISCDFEDKKNYVYSVNNIRKVEKELHALVRLGFNPDFCGEIVIDIRKYLRNTVAVGGVGDLMGDLNRNFV